MQYKVSLGCLWSRRLCFVGDDPSSSSSSFTNLSHPSLMSMILVKNLAGTALWHKTLPFAVWGDFQRPLHRLQIKHISSVMVVFHECRACASGRSMDPMATEVRRTLISCFRLFQYLLSQVLQMLLNLRLSRIQYDTEMVRILSHFLRKRRFFEILA